MLKLVNIYIFSQHTPSVLLNLFQLPFSLNNSKADYGPLRWHLAERAAVGGKVLTAVAIDAKSDWPFLNSDMNLNTHLYGLSAVNRSMCALCAGKEYEM